MIGLFIGEKSNGEVEVVCSEGSTTIKDNYSAQEAARIVFKFLNQNMTKAFMGQFVEEVDKVWGSSS